MQVTPQVPPPHVARVLGCVAGQLVQDAPHVVGSMSEAQTSPQACVPAAQAYAHTPRSQVAVADARSHLLAHLPQFVIDVWVSTHAPEHSVVLPGHASTHAAPAAVTAQRGVPPAHLVAQLPQDVLSPSDVSQPFS